MAQLKGGTQLWNAASIGQNAKSALAVIGSSPYVTVLIDCSLATHNVTFKIQVAGTAQDKPGRNELDNTADGGVTWYDYVGQTSIVVNLGTTAAIDLSPFGPSLLRLVRTDALGSDTVSAVVVTNGPN